MMMMMTKTCRSRVYYVSAVTACSVRLKQQQHERKKKRKMRRRVTNVARDSQRPWDDDADQMSFLSDADLSCRLLTDEHTNQSPSPSF